MKTLTFQTVAICLLLAGTIASGCTGKPGTEDSKNVQVQVDSSANIAPATSTSSDSILTREAARHSLFFLRDGDIWLANEDGKQQRQITHNEQITGALCNETVSSGSPLPRDSHSQPY